MSSPYLYSDVIKDGKCLKSSDGHYLFCDSKNHYHVNLTHDIRPATCCTCKATKKDWFSTRVDRSSLARPRYEVYNKDNDFFHDHKIGTLVWLKLVHSPDNNDYYIEAMVNQILVLLNRKEHESVLLSRQSGETEKRETTKDTKWTV